MVGPLPSIGAGSFASAAGRAGVGAVATLTGGAAATGGVAGFASFPEVRFASHSSRTVSFIIAPHEGQIDRVGARTRLQTGQFIGLYLVSLERPPDSGGRELLKNCLILSTFTLGRQH